MSGVAEQGHVLGDELEGLLLWSGWANCRGIVRDRLVVGGFFGDFASADQKCAGERDDEGAGIACGGGAEGMQQARAF